MQSQRLSFSEEKKLVGYLETDSGTLLLADGIWKDNLPVIDQQALVLDTEMERTKFPVFAVMQGGRRYLLIALDNETISTPMTNEESRVEVVTPLTDEELESRQSDEDEEQP